jgi:hypothetical protein
VSGPDVMGREEVADCLGVSIKRTQQLERDDPQFPESTRLARMRVWDGPAVRAYAKDRRRPDPKHTKVLQSFRKTGNVAQAARTAGVHVSTARRVLIDVGLIAAPVPGQEHPSDG